jgi:hypothetical protein
MISLLFFAYLAKARVIGKVTIWQQINAGLNGKLQSMTRLDVRETTRGG